MNPGDQQRQGKRDAGILGSPVTKRQLVIAFVIAGIADVVLAPSELLPFNLLVDLLTAGLLFVVLGWRIILLPALIAEAIPGIGVFPFWTMVVGSIAVFGAIRKPGDSLQNPTSLEGGVFAPGTDSSQTSEAPPAPPVYDEPTSPTKEKKKEETIIDLPYEEVKKEDQ